MKCSTGKAYSQAFVTVNFSHIEDLKSFWYFQHNDHVQYIQTKLLLLLIMSTRSRLEFNFKLT